LNTTLIQTKQKLVRTID